MATVEQLTVQFEGKGSEKLVRQLNSLSAAMNRLANRQGRAAKSTKSASKATDEYSSSLVKFHRNTGDVNTIIGKFGKKMSMMRSRLLIVAFAAGLVGKALSTLHKATSEFEVAQGKLNAVLASTGGVSGKTASQLENMANIMQVSMGQSNTVIMEMQARLLTFTSIVGKQFDKTIEIAVDMAAVLGTDLNSATIQIGKALNNPIEGLSALSRVGVSFTQQQKEQIKTMQESGNIIGAQKVILSELRTEFGGASNEIRENALTTKKLSDLQNEWGDLLREIGGYFKGIIAGLIDFGRAVVWLTQKTFESLNAFNDLINLWVQGEEATRESIDSYLELAEATASVSTQFTKFSTAMGGYTKEVQELSKANDNWTDIKQIQKWSNSITEAMSKDNRKIILDKISEALLNNKNIMALNKSEIDAHNEAIAGSLSNLEFKLAMLTAVSDEERMALAITKSRIEGVVDADKALEALTDSERELIQAYLEEKAIREDLTSEENLLKLYGKTELAQEKLIRSQIDAIRVLMEWSDNADELSSVLAMLEKQLEELMSSPEVIEETGKMWEQYNGAIGSVISTYEQLKLTNIENDRQTKLSAANSIRSERKRQKEIDKINKEYDKKAKKQKESLKAVKVSEAISNTALAITKVLDKPWLAALIGIQGALQVATIQAQKYQYGGLVGGNRHSQGGTLIEAEKGEFVMSRKAVDSIGIETMNRINQGGGAGSINISFNGNVLSKDFIEDEAIPQIKEAIRRGADIGVG